MKINTLSRKRNLKTPLLRYAALGLFIVFSMLALTSCGSKKPKVVTTKKERARLGGRQPVVNYDRDENAVTNEETETTYEESAPTSEDIAIEKARTFLGTKWKYAGNDERGIDCSGLICTSFAAAGRTVPRTTWTLKEASNEVDIDEVVKGDLLFFATGSNKKRLNHVGMVVNVTPAEVQFIHSSTSRGVIISSLNEPFWLGSYLSAGRLEE